MASHRFISRLVEPVLREPMTFAALGAIGGILFAEGSRSPLWLFALFLLVLIRPWPRRQLPVFWIVFAFLLFGSVHRVRDIRSERLLSILDSRGEQFTIPVTFRGVVRESLPRNGYLVHLTSLSKGVSIVRCDNLARLELRTRSIRPGDRISGQGRIRRPPQIRNPGERSQSERFDAVLEVPSHLNLERTGVSPWYRAQSFAANCRNWIGMAITQGLPENSEAGGLLQAMVLGAREEASRAAEESFRKSGALHIFAVSGLHVGIFASVIWAMLRILQVPRKGTILTIALAIFFYAFITGLRPSAVRASLMLTVVLTGFALHREPRLRNSLGLAAILILIVDSHQLFAIGFQLSFSVLAAIALLTPPLNRFFQSGTRPDPFIPRSLITRRQWQWQAVGSYGSGLVSVSLAAWLGSLPWILWYFGLLTPISVVANCFLVPVAWLVMAMATLSLSFSLLHLPWLPSMLNQVNALLVHALQAMAAFFAQLPGAHFEMTPVSVSVSERIATPSSLVVFDLQTSCSPQAIFLSPDRNRTHAPVWLIDPGDFSGYNRVIRPWLRREHVRELEGLLLSHGDSKHIDAAPFCLDDFSVRRVIFSPLPNRSPVWNRLRQQSPPPGQTRLQLNAGSHLQLAPDVDLRILFPPPDHPDQSLSDDECLVLLLNWHGWRILSMADSGFLTEKWLLHHRPDLRCDVLIKSHHSQDPSALPGFLRQLQPRCVIATNVSFPATESLSREFRQGLEEAGILLLDQAQTGAITLTPTPEKLHLSTFRDQASTVIDREKR